MSNGANGCIDPSRQRQLRALFPGCAQHPYLDTAGRCLLATPVRKAIDAYLDEQAIHGGDKYRMFQSVERVRDGFASMIGASADEVAISKNVSEGLNIVAHSLDWRLGDNVVLCGDVEHPNNIYPWMHAARLYGLNVRNITSRDGHIELDLIRKVADARTRIISVSATSFLPGFRTDLTRIAELCSELGAELVVDAAQSAGIQCLDVRALGVGALAASTQKGLLGLYGMGFLFCRKDLAERLTPRYLARFGVDVGDRHEADFDESGEIRFRRGALRFDLGNYNFLAAAALEPALAILLAEGIQAIDHYTHKLAVALGDALADLKLPVVGWPAGPHIGSIVTIGSLVSDVTMARHTAHLAEKLRGRGVKFSERRGCLRFSFHIYNNMEDVEEVVRVAKHWGC